MLTLWTVGTELLTIALTIAAVALSLWYIERRNRIEDADTSKVSATEKTGRAKNDEGATGRRAPPVDVESQQVEKTTS